MVNKIPKVLIAVLIAGIAALVGTIAFGKVSAQLGAVKRAI